MTDSWVMAAMIRSEPRRHKGQVAISRLNTRIEVHSAFGGKVRSGHIEPEQFELSCERLRRDVYERRFRVLTMKATHYQEAERLLKTYTADRGLRTLDSLQLAAALLELHRESRLDQFVCADETLADVASLEGIMVFNPTERERPRITDRKDKATFCASTPAVTPQCLRQRAPSARGNYRLPSAGGGSCLIPEIAK